MLHMEGIQKWEHARAEGEGAGTGNKAVVGPVR